MPVVLPYVPPTNSGFKLPVRQPITHAEGSPEYIKTQTEKANHRQYLREQEVHAKAKEEALRLKFVDVKMRRPRLIQIQADLKESIQREEEQTTRDIKRLTDDISTIEKKENLNQGDIDTLEQKYERLIPSLESLRDIYIRIDEYEKQKYVNPDKEMKPDEFRDTYYAHAQYSNKLRDFKKKIDNLKVKLATMEESKRIESEEIQRQKDKSWGSWFGKKYNSIKSQSSRVGDEYEDIGFEIGKASKPNLTAGKTKKNKKINKSNKMKKTKSNKKIKSNKKTKSNKLNKKYTRNV